MAFDDVDDLIVVTFVKADAPARFGCADQEEGDAGVALILADELVGHTDETVSQML